LTSEADPPTTPNDGYSSRFTLQISEHTGKVAATKSTNGILTGDNGQQGIHVIGEEEVEPLVGATVLANQTGDLVERA